MKKKTLITGALLGAAAAAALSSKAVRGKVKNAITKDKEKSKLDAIREILEDKKDAGIEKAEGWKEKLSNKKSNK